MNDTAPAVLVVEDDDPLRRLIAAALAGSGFRVLAADDGQEALAPFRRHGRDVSMVLLDVGLPGLDGPATLLALRAIDPGRPLLLHERRPRAAHRRVAAGGGRRAVLHQAVLTG